MDEKVDALKSAVEYYNSKQTDDKNKLTAIDFESGDTFDKLASFSKALTNTTDTKKFADDNNNGGKAAFDAVKSALDDYSKVTLDKDNKQDKAALSKRDTADSLTKATDDKKKLYTDADKGLAQANLLTGKTVGLAASNDTVDTASGKDAITITANTAGIGGQISGFNISISDSKGNVKKSANAALDAF